MNLAGVAFGHDWLAGVDRYYGTLEHLASWGIVAAAPATETSVAPSVMNLAFDLGTTFGHHRGGAPWARQDQRAPIQARRRRPRVRRFGGGVRRGRACPPSPRRWPRCSFPTVTEAARQGATRAATLQVPGLVLTAPGDPATLRSNAVELSRAWKGATLRTVSDAKAGGLIEGRRLARVVGLPGADRTTQKVVRALLTGYLLHSARQVTRPTGISPTQRWRCPRPRWRTRTPTRSTSRTGSSPC